jgi:hypothetical protein
MLHFPNLHKEGLMSATYVMSTRLLGSDSDCASEALCHADTLLAL